MSFLSPTTPIPIPNNRSTPSFHLTNIRASPRSEATDSPSSAQSTPPTSSSSLLGSSSPRKFSRALRAHSIERFAGPPLKRKGADRTELSLSKATHRGKIQATSDAQPTPSRSATVTPQGEDDKLTRTRLRIMAAVSPLINLANYAGRAALTAGVQLLPYAPVPGLAGVAKLLLGIWDALLLVSANKQACIRLADRCATILAAIHKEVQRVGVTEDLKHPLCILEDVFDDILQFLQRQTERNFIQRYIWQDDISAEISHCNTALVDCLFNFGISINLTVLGYVAPNITPKISNLRVSQDILDPVDIPVVNFAPDRSNPSDDDKIHEKIHRIQAKQNIRDFSRDCVELEKILHQALEAESDAETLQILQLSDVDMLGVIKMLLRALEQTRRTAAFPDSSSISPSQPTRTSTWPPDCVETKEINLLHKASTERNVAILKREWGEMGPLPHLPSWIVAKYEVDQGAQIGHGYFSKVYKGTCRRRTVAVKVIESHTPNDVLNEYTIWRSLQHPNILQFYGTSGVEIQLPWFIVSPFIRNGSLSDYLKRIDLGMRNIYSSSPSVENDEPNFLQLTYDIGNGMEYLHQEGILHCDLKAANVLVDDEKRCVVADFGHSKRMSKVTHETPAPSHALRWQAPEVMRNCSNPTKKADVYSFAMCCVEVLTMGNIPWPDESDAAVRKYVLEHNLRPPYPTDLAARLGLDCVIQESWNNAYQNRPSFSKITKSIEHLLNTHSRSPYATLAHITSRDQSSSSVHFESRPDVDTLRTTFAPVTGSPSLFAPSTVTLTEDESQNDLDSDFSSVTSPVVHDPSDDEYELTYRQCLSHEFPRSLTVPLWTPSIANVGDVGYLERPSGRFVRLFSAFDPAVSSEGKLDIPSLSSLGKIPIFNQKDRRESAVERSMKAIVGAMSSQTINSPKQAVERILTFPTVGQKTAHLCAEKVDYHYLKGSPIYKEWFKSHRQAILATYGNDPGFEREDLIFIIECLKAKHYALFVSHGHWDSEIQFNIASSPNEGQDWGIFVRPALADEDGSYKTKVSKVGDEPKALLVCRLHFQSDVEEPTLLP